MPLSLSARPFALSMSAQRQLFELYLLRTHIGHGHSMSRQYCGHEDICPIVTCALEAERGARDVVTMLFDGCYLPHLSHRRTVCAVIISIINWSLIIELRKIDG